MCWAVLAWGVGAIFVLRGNGPVLLLRGVGLYIVGAVLVLRVVLNLFVKTAQEWIHIEY